MNSKGVWQIVGRTIFWCAVVAFFVFAAMLRSRNEQARTVERVEIVVKDGDKASFITPEIALELLSRAGIDPVGKSVDSVDLAKINRVITSNSFTHKAITYITYDGTLTVELTQRPPLMRVMTNQGHNFYLTRDMWVLPVQPHTTQNLPIVTGSLWLPFGSAFEGNLKEWLTGEEKNYQESYNFIVKLINFVVLTENSPTWKDKFVQIVLHQGPETTPEGGNVKGAKKSSLRSLKSWQEPEIELIPREGNYSVYLGTLSDVEAKLERLIRFVEAGVVDLNEGGTLSVEFDGQAIWTPEPQKKKSK